MCLHPTSPGRPRVDRPAKGVKNGRVPVIVSERILFLLL